MKMFALAAFLGLGTASAVCSPCYEKPPACTGSETSVQITGVTGDFCSPLCYQNQCPKGDGSFTATPSCVLETQGSSKPTQCALICTPGDNAACPAGASCQSIQGEGICTYPASAGSNQVLVPVKLIPSNVTTSYNGTATWTDCSKGGDTIDTVTVTPENIVKGATTVISGTATIGKEVTAGTWALALKWNGIPLPVSGGSGSICEAGTVTLPLNGGTLNVGAMACPVAAGSDPIPLLTLNLATGAPPGAFEATLSTKMDGADGICASIKFSI